MPEMYLNNRDLLTVLVDHLQKPKKELKNLKKQEKQTILTKMNLISLVLAYGGFKYLAKRTASD